MKIAICISGQPRSVKTGYDYMKNNLLNPYKDHEIDFFIHTWANDSKTSDLYDSIYEVKSDRIDIPLNKKYINARFPKIDSPAYPAFNTYSMFYSVFHANQLKKDWEDEKGFKFDVVVRTRFDFLINKNMDFSDIQSGKIYVPDCRNDPNRIFCTDQFAYGTSEVMDLYSNTYQNLNYLYDKGVIMNGEHMLSANLGAYGLIRENMIYKNFNPPFPPGKYDSNWHYICRDDFSNWNNIRG